MLVPVSQGSTTPPESRIKASHQGDVTARADAYPAMPSDPKPRTTRTLVSHAVTAEYRATSTTASAGTRGANPDGWGASASSQPIVTTCATAIAAPTSHTITGSRR